MPEFQEETDWSRGNGFGGLAPEIVVEAVALLVMGCL